jgi:putative transposase
MPKKRHTEERILAGLHKVKAGGTIPDVCRKPGVRTATFYLWRKKYSGLGLNEPGELRQLRDENSKLKWLVVDLSLDRHMPQEPISRKL